MALTFFGNLILRAKHAIKITKVVPCFSIWGLKMIRRLLLNTNVMRCRSEMKTKVLQQQFMFSSLVLSFKQPKQHSMFGFFPTLCHKDLVGNIQ